MKQAQASEKDEEVEFQSYHLQTSNWFSLLSYFLDLFYFFVILAWTIGHKDI